MSGPWTDYAPDYRGMVTAAADKYGIPQDILHNLAHTESRYNPDAVSPKGARGIMQLMPDTAKELNVDPNDPAQNIDGGARYLKAQHDRFGDWKLAAAAYNAGPGRVAKAGGVPDIPETQAYVQSVAPEAQAALTGEVAAASDAPPWADYAAAATPITPQPAQAPKPAAPAPAKALRPDDALGFLKGAFTSVDHGANWLRAGLDRLPQVEAPLAKAGAGLRQALPDGLVKFIDNPQGYYDAQAITGRRPGKLGEFAGNVAGTMFTGGNPLISGAASGALLSDKKDVGGVLGDAALGGATGRLTALGSDALQLGARKVLSKAPKIMTVPGLKAAYQSAYKAVDNSGFAFPKAEVQGLVSDFENSVGSMALSKSAREDAEGIIQYARTKLATGDVSLSQMDKLRTDIYNAMVKKGGDTAALGSAFRNKIDAMIDGSGNPAISQARELYKRWTTADFVNRASKSADRAAEQTYGGDYGRKLKDRLAPLVDELKPTKNIRGASDDVKAAIEKIVRGTKTQNLASTVGGMLDPRRLGGKIAAGITTTGGGAGALATGGLSLLAPALQMGTGLGLTATSSGIARKNVDDLLKLIAAGGSKQALASVPTKTSQSVESLIAALRPALVASAVPATAVARPASGAKR